MENIRLKVSLGEALDKLTILSIKLKKIQEGERKKEVEKEFLSIQSELSNFKKFSFYYKILMKINENIWDKLDEFRTISDEKKQNKLFKEITNENDNRYRVKNKINILCNSNLKEQKGYKLKEAFVLTHTGLGDNITAIGLVRYLSTCYDKVFVVCKNFYVPNVQLFYDDDPSIILFPIDYRYNINGGFKEEKIINGKDLYIAGDFEGACKNLPLNFYEYLKIDPEYFWDYYHMNELQQHDDLYYQNNLEDIEYIFIHQLCSSINGQIFNIEDAEQHFDFNKHKTLIVNPCENMYNKEDKFFDLAQKFVFKSIFYYQTVIKNASKIILTDSCFFCLTLNIKTKASTIYVHPRSSEAKSLYILSNLNRNNEYIFWSK